MATRAWVDFEVDEYFRSIAPFTRQDTLDVERMEQPVATVAAHTAPMAIHFYTGDQFPPNTTIKPLSRFAPVCGATT